MLQIEDFGELVVGEGSEEDEHGEVVFLVEGTVVSRSGGVFAVGDEVTDGHHHADSECYQEYPVSCHIQSAYNVIMDGDYIARLLSSGYGFMAAKLRKNSHYGDNLTVEP